MSDRYGNRKMPKIISEWRDLANACRAEGTPAIQAALDRVEPVIDAAFQGDAVNRAARALGNWCLDNVAHHDGIADLLRDLDRVLGNPPPDLVEAGKVAERLSYGVILSGLDLNHRDLDKSADTIRALIALATAQAAQIAGLEDKLAFVQRREIASNTEFDEVWSEAQAEAATLRAKVAELEAQIAGMIDADTVQKMLDSAQPIMAEACRGYEETIADLRTDVATLRAMQAEREAALQELRFHVDDAVKAWNAHEAAEATVASLQAQVERLRGALEKINVGEGWAAKIAREALKEAGHEPT